MVLLEIAAAADDDVKVNTINHSFIYNPYIIYILILFNILFF